MPRAVELFGDQPAARPPESFTFGQSVSTLPALCGPVVWRLTPSWCVRHRWAEFAPESGFTGFGSRSPDIHCGPEPLSQRIPSNKQAFASSSSARIEPTIHHRQLLAPVV